MIWDIKRDVDPSERVKIYRKLRAAIRQALRSGAKIKWVQRSAVLVAPKEHATRIASILDRPGIKLNIYKVVEEFR